MGKEINNELELLSNCPVSSEQTQQSEPRVFSPPSVLVGEGVSKSRDLREGKRNEPKD